MQISLPAEDKSGFDSDISFCVNFSFDVVNQIPTCLDHIHEIETDAKFNCHTKSWGISVQARFPRTVIFPLVQKSLT